MKNKKTPRISLQIYKTVLVKFILPQEHESYIWYFHFKMTGVRRGLIILKSSRGVPTMEKFL